MTYARNWIEEWRRAEAEGPILSVLPNAKTAKSAKSSAADGEQAPFGSFDGFGNDQNGAAEPVGSDVVVALEERAALIECGANVPREWAEGFARLDLARPVKGFTERQWRQLIDDGGKFLDRWAAEAERMGWRPVDVFGVHPIAPNANNSLSGLALLINGGEVIRLAKHHATIQTPRGSELSYVKREMAGSVAVWELVETAA
jgi:hypothetical protein